jgi:PAS domain S-box-containing protein
LRDSEENLRITLNSIGDGVIATDVTGRVVRMNPVAERLTGWPSSEATGQRLPEVYRLVNARDREPVADPIARVLADGKEGGVSGDGYPLLIARDGREYLVADSGAPMRSASGETLGSVVVFRDVTDESAAQEQLRQSQKLDAIGRLAGGIAHDFNNMLSGILGGAELLQASLAAGDPNRKHLAMIIDTAVRAADLANNLLAFARQQEFHVVPTDIHRAIGDAVGLLESTIDKRIRIEVLLAPESCVVMGDGTQLQSIFLNLGIHAWHAMPEGGVLSISTALVDLSDADCRGSAGELVPGRYVEVKVRDTGRGIAPANLSRIFDPFFANGTDTRGPRLGLAAVYGMVRQHKGAILVRSEVGRGTYFRVLLPVTREPVPPPSTGTGPVPGRGRILVVDDEAIIREIAVAMLSRCGYDVLVAEDGRVALEIYRKRFAEIDLVILDMVMPAMGGRECFNELKRICPGVRILFASGVAQEEDLNDLRAQGLAGLVRKPFRGAELSRAVADALGTGVCAAAEAPGGARRDPGATV